MNEKICIYAICKNESKFVDRWIDSLKEADKIVVLDTGSTDDTIEKLKKYEPLVEVHQKIFDPFNFDDARNESMKYIPEDTTICVMADLDTVFRKGWSTYLREDFDKGYDEVYGPFIDTTPVSGEPSKIFLSKNVHRYEKYGKHWKWQRHVHEEIYYEGDQYQVKGYTDNRFIIEHHPDRDKKRDYLDILKREYEENSKDPYTAIYYGCELSYHGYNKESIRVFLDAIDNCNFNGHSDIECQLYINIANYYSNIGDYDIALKFVYTAESFGIYTRRLYMTQARIEKSAKHYINAVKRAEKAYSVVNDCLNWMDDRNWFNSNDIEIFIKDCQSNINKSREIAMKFKESSKGLMYLANNALANGDNKEAVKYFKDCYYVVINNNLDEHYRDYKYILLCCIPIVNYSNFDSNILKEYVEAIRYILDGYLYPDNRKSRICLANYFFKVNEYSNALIQYKKALSIKEKTENEIDTDDLYTDEYLSEIYYSIAEIYNLLYLNTTDYDYIDNALAYIDEAIRYNQNNQTTNNLANQIRISYKKSFEEFANRKHTGSNKICVYAITKNESKFVKKWIDSMKEADYIVVLDTGSTDNTVEGLKNLKYNNVIVRQKEYDIWRFDIARNDALRLVPKDCNILISTDLDEVLEPGWADILRSNWVESIHQRAEYKYSWSHLPNGEDGRVFTYNKIHSRNWIWKYPVHELLVNIFDNENENYPREVALNFFDQIHLHHYPDQTKSRASYLPLLELRARAYQEDWYGLIYLAHEYYYRGFYQKSIDEFNYILSNFSDKYSLLEKASCYLFMGDDYAALKDTTNAIDNYIKAINLDPSYREPYLGLANVYLSINNYTEATKSLKDALLKTYRHYTWLERDTSWTYEIYDLLCLATYYGGNKKDSIIYAAKALYYEPENERLRNNLKLCIENTTDTELLN